MGWLALSFLGTVLLFMHNPSFTKITAYIFISVSLSFLVGYKLREYDLVGLVITGNMLGLVFVIMAYMLVKLAGVVWSEA